MERSEPRTQEAGHGERPRAVLLGASNLTRGLPAAVAAARQRLGGPIEALVAAGHGRSYGSWSSVLARGLPGITECGLWRALAEDAARQTGPRLALITDVGNDIGYGAPPQTVAGWVDGCAARLAAAGYRGVISRLPLERLQALPEWRLRLASRLLFPRLRLPPGELLRRAATLDGALDEVAERHGFVRVGLGRRWYGPDGIHIWRWRLGAAWAALLAGKRQEKRSPPGSFASLVDRWRLTVTRPERYRWFGSERGGRGGCRLHDGSRLRLF